LLPTQPALPSYHEAVIHQDQQFAGVFLMSDRKPLNFGIFFSEDSIETTDMEKGIKD